MKRHLTKLVVFLFLGAIVNVAVAWGCAYTASRYTMFDNERTLSDQEFQMLWQQYVGEIGQDKETDGTIASATRTTSIFILVQPSDDGSIDLQPITACCLILRAGWPFRSLEECEYYNAGSYGRKRWTEHLWSVDREPLNWRTSWWFRQIPTSPIWPGFAIDTIFYGAILWLLTLGPFAARRVIRRKRGRCIKCGYDLRGAEHRVCPECGEELRARSKV